MGKYSVGFQWYTQHRSIVPCCRNCSVMYHPYIHATPAEIPFPTPHTRLAGSTPHSLLPRLITSSNPTCVLSNQGPHINSSPSQCRRSNPSRVSLGSHTVQPAFSLKNCTLIFLTVCSVFLDSLSLRVKLYYMTKTQCSAIISAYRPSKLSPNPFIYVCIYNIFLYYLGCHFFTLINHRSVYAPIHD